MRDLTPFDRLLVTADAMLKIASGHAPSSGRASPADEILASQREPWLESDEADEAARLMRVNHSGEVAAQGLYYGQLLTTQNAEARAQLESSAREEGDHLHWCRARIEALGGRPSLLNPLWFVGSAAMGATAGLFGPAASLGFVDETERQVEQHLEDHLRRLPAADTASRAVLERMRIEEGEHGAAAMALGGKKLPWVVRAVLMPATASIMKNTSYRI
ncbi:MAG: 2-polyprenyl-3-methyl-6-methoxy-1,4-benzoquinone monooxygenase [Thioalkalivibrionaceae bacterium]